MRTSASPGPGSGTTIVSMATGLAFSLATTAPTSCVMGVLLVRLAHYEARKATATLAAPSEKRRGSLAVSAYVLIQTEVGEAAQVGAEVAKIDGVHSAE